ncbi:unnamed protein product [Caenorhabditis nigoni]
MGGFTVMSPLLIDVASEKLTDQQPATLHLPQGHASSFSFRFISTATIPHWRQIIHLAGYDRIFISTRHFSHSF